jgi:hypothetical protein
MTESIGYLPTSGIEPESSCSKLKMVSRRLRVSAEERNAMPIAQLFLIFFKDSEQRRCMLEIGMNLKGALNLNIAVKC